MKLDKVLNFFDDLSTGGVCAGFTVALGMAHFYGETLDGTLAGNAILVSMICVLWSGGLKGLLGTIREEFPNEDSYNH